MTNSLQRQECCLAFVVESPLNVSMFLSSLKPFWELRRQDELIPYFLPSLLLHSGYKRVLQSDKLMGSIYRWGLIAPATRHLLGVAIET